MAVLLVTGGQILQSYFIINRQVTAGPFATAFGPFTTKEAAVSVAEKLVMPGEYLVLGPAEPVHAVTITAPQINSTPL